MSSLNNIYLYVRINDHNKLDITLKPLNYTEYQLIILKPNNDCILTITNKYDPIFLQHVIETYIWYTFIVKNTNENLKVNDFCNNFFSNQINHDYINFKKHINEFHFDKNKCKNEFCIGNWFNLYQNHLKTCNESSCIFKELFHKINDLFLIYEYTNLLIKLK